MSSSIQQPSYGATSTSHRSSGGIVNALKRSVGAGGGSGDGNGNEGEQQQQQAKAAGKVEPKVYLASERTFFSWIRVSLLLGSFGLALFNGGDSMGRVMGLIYAGISILAIFYAYAMHIRRSHRIRTTYAGHFDELYGPTIICVLLFAAVLANFILRVKHHNGKMKTPKSPWLAAYLTFFVDMQDPSSSAELLL